MNIDELGVIRLVRFRSDVTINLVAAWMTHCLQFRKLSGVLTFTNRRMIPRYLFNAIVAKFVKTRIADMADRCRAVFDQGNGQDTGHAVPLRPRSGKPVNL